MRPLYTLIFASTLLFISCDKDLSYEGGPIPPVKEPPVVVPPVVIPPVVVPPVVVPPVLTTEEKLRKLFVDYKFQLRAFYSDIPIHFNGNPALETDFFHYVPAYLKDDANTFTETGEVIIEQNAVKKSNLPAATFTRPYSLGEDADGLYIMFLDANYNTLKYHVAEVGEDYFILSVAGQDGSTLYSRFEKL